MSSRRGKSRWAKAIGVLALLLLLAVSGCSDGEDSKNAGHNDRPVQSLNQSDAPEPVDQSVRLKADADGQAVLNVEACSSAPCDPRDVSVIDLFSNRPGSSGMASSVGPAVMVEEVMEKGLRLAGASPVHLVVRGTAVADSARCDWRGIARTVEQREDAIRFWLGLDADDEIPDASYLEDLFTATISVLEPEYQETAYSNFLAIVRGGLSTKYMFLTCYIDYMVSEYLLGSGPAKLTIAYDRRGEAPSYELYRAEYEAGTFSDEPLQTRGAYQDSLQNTVVSAEASLRMEVGGRELVVFLAPMGAHNAIAVEAWQAVAQWDLQTAEDGTVNAVRYGTSAGGPGAHADAGQTEEPHHHGDHGRDIDACSHADPDSQRERTDAVLPGHRGLWGHHPGRRCHDDLHPGAGGTVVTRACSH